MNLAVIQPGRETTASSVARAMGMFWFCVFCRRPVGAEELANHRCVPEHVMQRGEAA